MATPQQDPDANQEAIAPAVDAAGTSSPDALVRLRHDLKTSLNVVLVTLDWLAESALTPEQRRLVTLCRSSADTLFTLVSDAALPGDGQRRLNGEERSDVALDDLASLGVAYLEKPVATSELRNTVAGAMRACRDRTGQARVLVADDASEIVWLVRSALTEPTYRVDGVDNGAAALDRFKAVRYDVVIVDLEMPVMDGRAAVRAMRQWERANGREPTPIIVLSGHAPVHEAPAKGREEREEEAERTGPDHAASLPDPEIADLIPEFLTNRRADVDAIDEALQQGQYETIDGVGHKLSGLGRSYGFDTISEIGQALQTAAVERQDRAIEQLTRRLAAYLDGIRAGSDE